VASVSDWREWDYPPTKRPRMRPEIIVGEYRVIETRRHRPALSFGWAMFITAIAVLIVLRFAWKPLLMAAVLLGVVTSPATALGVIVGLVILGAAWLQSRLSGRPF
jgi:hypothetical protein